MKKTNKPHFGSILENVSDLAAVLDVNGRIRYVNLATRQTLAYTSEQLLGNSIFDFIHPDDLSTATETFQYRVDSPHAPIDNLMQLRFRHSNGQWRNLEGTSNNLLDDPDVNGIVLLARDVSESKQAEEILRKSEERFRTISSNTPDHILVQDSQLRYTLVINPQMGLTQEDMIGRTDFDFLPKKDAERLTQIKTQVLESGKPFHIETHLTSIKGETEFFDGTFTPKFDPQGQVDGLIGYFRNVTERKRVEDELRQSEAALRQAQKVAHVGSWVWHIQSNQLEWSDEMYTIFGIEKENFSGDLSEVISSVIHPEDRPRVINSNLSVI
jgi:PAS domain S-box-containing protein